MNQALVAPNSLATMAHMYQQDGYVIIPELLDAETLALARKESVALCRGERGPIDGVLPAGPEDDDAAVLRRYLCLHFPHKISPMLRDLARLPRAVAALTEVIGPNVKLMQSMLFIKSGGSPARRGTRTRRTFRQGTGR